MLEVLRTVESFSQSIKRAIETKGTDQDYRLKDDFDAILFYQNASADVQAGIDTFMSYLCYRNVGVLIEHYFTALNNNEDYKKNYCHAVVRMLSDLIDS